MWKFVFGAAIGLWVGHWWGVVDVSKNVAKICDAYSCQGTHK